MISLYYKMFYSWIIWDLFNGVKIGRGWLRLPESAELDKDLRG